MNTTYFDVSVAQFQLFLIMFIRVLGILAASPVFGHRTFVNQAKVGFALVLSILLFPAVHITLAATTDLLPFIIVVIKELILGMMVGFVARLVFIAVQFAGEVIGIDIGFGVVNIIDPMSAERISIIGTFKNLLAILIFLIILIILRKSDAEEFSQPLGIDRRRERQ